MLVALLALLLAGCGACGAGLPLPSVARPARCSCKGDAALTPEMIAAENPYLDSQRRVGEAARQRFAAATVAMAAQDWDTARADLEWLVAEHPKLSGPYLNLALLHAAQGQPKKAEHYFQATLEVNRTQPRCLQPVRDIPAPGGPFRRGGEDIPGGAGGRGTTTR